ncbi:MAG TPA: hypothetical protein VM095_01605, partial [Pyrinomonadaceae bacterium]|nr:hypothetical protein [Pyrinomonadaceae bacterium]
MSAAEKRAEQQGGALSHKLWWLILGRVAAAVLLFGLSTTLFSREQSGDSGRSALLIFITVVGVSLIYAVALRFNKRLRLQASIQ